MIFYEWNMLIGDELILPLLHKHDRMQDMKHENVKGIRTMNINGWEVACGWCNKWGLQCVDIPCAN
jgi:hypothetical protein